MSGNFFWRCQIASQKLNNTGTYDEIKELAKSALRINNFMACYIINVNLMNEQGWLGPVFITLGQSIICYQFLLVLHTIVTYLGTIKDYKEV